jgi:hypothetical protein
MTAPEAAKTTEGQICNDIVALLARQKQEIVTPALNELRAQLQHIYNGKSNKDIAACQIGLALAALGLGDHQEARRLFDNVLKIAGGDEFVVINTLVGFANIGDLERAHAYALECQTKFTGLPSVLERVNSVLEDTLDFATAADCISHRLKIGDPTHPEQKLLGRVELLRRLTVQAEHLGYSPADLRARAQYVSTTLQARGRKIYWLNLRGNGVNSVSLEMYVDASPEVCAELNYDVAEALFDKFGDRTGGELVPISIRSYVGHADADLHLTQAVNA